MPFLHKLLHKRSDDDLYAELIDKTKTRLANYRASAPLAYDAILYDSELLKSVNSISKKAPDVYWKSRFLSGLLFAAWAIQRKAYWEQARLESEAMASGGRIAIDDVAVFERVLHMKDAQLQREVLLEGAGIAAMAVRHDADVDLKVARDLGRADNYPERLPLPAEGDENEMFRAMSWRVRLFWQTVLPIPVYPLLDIVARPDGPPS